MTFCPSAEEFRSFSRYIAYMESQGAHRAGLAKVIPPKEWRPRLSYDDIDDLLIPAPIQQVVTGQSGLFTQYNIQKKAMTLREFRKTANSDRFCSPHYDNFEELERKYWKNVTFNPPIYGADVNGTLYDPGIQEWNVGRLRTVLDTVESESGITIEGVNTPYLYLGMWKTTFAWHTEDMDLYSINYLHFGEPKSWYCVPPEHGKRLERLAKGFFPGSSQNCEAFLRHKMTLISPSILRKYGIPFEKITQEAGEFMVTFPYSYHAGFNHGFNCAESTNFAMQRWIDYGKQAVLCSCRKDMVKISMDVFVRKYQPERYELWLAGKDSAPIDHARPTPEAAEFLGRGHAHSLGGGASSGRPEEEEEEAKSQPKHRIGTKRHHVALEVPEHVLLGGSAQERQEEEEEDEEDEEDEPYLHWPTIRGAHDTSPTHRPSPERSLSIPSSRRGGGGGATGVGVGGVTGGVSGERGPVRVLHSLSALPRPLSKPGVASLLFHRTLSPGEEAAAPLPPKATPLLVRPALVSAHRQVPTTSLERSVAEVPAARLTTDAILEAPGNGGCGGDVGDAILEARSPGVVAAETREGTPAEAKTKMKGHRQPLSKLPRQHPLMQEIAGAHESLDEAPPAHGDAAEDDEGEDLEEGEGGGSDDDQELWPRLLARLWQSRPRRAEAERLYNRRVGRRPPHCAVCLLFHTYSQGNPIGATNRRPAGLSSSSGGEEEEDEWSSPPLIPEMCFSSGGGGVGGGVGGGGGGVGGGAEGGLTTPHLREDGTSRLLTCAECCVRVHASCYGVSNDTPADGWRCTRCEAGAVTEDCCLCSLRGGALKPANNDKWVHVLCAVAVLEARFVSAVERGPVDLSHIPLQRFKLKCHYCRKLTKKASAPGCCVQCSHGRCPTAFHPTCAQAAGVLLRPDDWPFVVHVTCHRHKAAALPERSKESLQALSEGQRVICKHRNGRYYRAEVSELSRATFYEVAFDDGSFSDNLFPEDITNRDCLALGPPPEGAAVQVRWTDGLEYGAKFVAEHVIPMYLVEFEDGSQLSAKREDVYSLDEDLPKRVKTRLSVASDMRFKGVFVEKEPRQQQAKRQRVVNSRYREDYIEPVVYRALME